MLTAGGCRPIALLIVHVDDFLIFGNPEDQRFQQLRTGLLKLYEWQPWERGSFEQTGSSVEQLRDGDFRITQPRFAESVGPITVDRSRRNQPEHETDAREKTALRALLGAVLWRASQSAPWLSVVLSFLLSEVPRSTVATLHEANKLLRSMRRTAQLPLRIFGHRDHKVAFIAYRKLPGLAELTAPATGGYTSFSSAGAGTSTATFAPWCRLLGAATSCSGSAGQALAPRSRASRLPKTSWTSAACCGTR